MASQESLATQLKLALKELKELNALLRPVIKNVGLYVSYKHSMARAFLKGIMYGLGALAAVALIIPVTIWFLRGIQWPPLIGSFLSKVLMQIDQSRLPPAGGGDL